MIAKKRIFSDAERVKRIREAAREHETSNDPRDFERAFVRVVKSAGSKQLADIPKKSDLGGNA